MNWFRICIWIYWIQQFKKKPVKLQQYLNSTRNLKHVDIGVWDANTAQTESSRHPVQLAGICEIEQINNRVVILHWFNYRWPRHENYLWPSFGRKCRDFELCLSMQQIPWRRNICYVAEHDICNNLPNQILFVSIYSNPKLFGYSWLVSQQHWVADIIVYQKMNGHLHNEKDIHES